MSDEGFCFIFAVGSLINDDSRAASVGSSGVAAAARLLPSFGAARSWCFRASSGFTALGLTFTGAPTAVNGCVFRVALSHLATLDDRERGYERVLVAREHFQLAECEPAASSTVSSCLAADALRRRNDAAEVAAGLLEPDAAVYVYVPERTDAAAEDFPLLQTYVDVCLSGCYAWGGEAFAEEFLLTTSGWSSHFLNDVATSRRPWLNRGPLHAVIDALLAKHGERTRFAERRHPEEYAARSSGSLSGCWGVPRRNADFTGREKELAALRALLTKEGGGGVQIATVCGLGGVGKTQLVAEYAWRHSQGGGGHTDGYGLVAWIHAETAETIAGDLRRLALDCGVSARDRPAHEVLDELKSRLFRSLTPWLLVFDNCENAEALAPFLPRGAAAGGHALATSRRAAHPARTVNLHCFASEEAVAFLARAAGVPARDAAAAELADTLGCLPLALSIAAAFMRRADVSCADYLSRVTKRAALLERDVEGGCPLSVASSLSLSLARIEDESRAARAALDALAYVAPDGVTKPLLRELLRHAAEWGIDAEVSPRVSVHEAPAIPSNASRWEAAALACGVAAALAAIALSRDSSGAAARVLLPLALLGGAASLGLAVHSLRAATPLPPPPASSPSDSIRTRHVSSSAVQFSGEAELESLTDGVWALLKRFSLLTSSGAQERATETSAASIHRLLQAVIRADHSAARARACVRAVSDALQTTWRYSASDAASWAAAGLLVEHVKALGRAAGAHGVRREQAASLLTSAGAFTALALSRFSEAREMLEAARGLACDAAAAAGGADDDSPCLADALIELAKVLRYQGDLTAAEAAARRALESRERTAADAGACPRVAAALHELGVLRLRAHDLEGGGALLRRALEVRRAAGAPPAEQASTMHHLAVSHLNARPPALDAAEALLRDALAAQGGEGAAAAATMLQLGRLELRRGRRAAGREAMEAARNLARAAYGREAHVNVAAAEHALGSCAVSEGDVDAAVVHFMAALDIRGRVYADAPHRELAATLGALGRCAHTQRRLDEAASRLAEQRDVLYAVMRDGPADQRAGAESDLRASLKWARSVASDAGDAAACEELARQMRALSGPASGPDEAACSLSFRSPQRQAAAPPLQPRPSHAAALACRAAVRQELCEAAALRRAPDAATLLRCVEEMRAASVGDADGVPAEVAAFSSALLAAVAEGGAVDACALFSACDVLRELLRGRGWRVDDAPVSPPGAERDDCGPSDE